MTIFRMALLGFLSARQTSTTNVFCLAITHHLRAGCIRGKLSGLTSMMETTLLRSLVPSLFPPSWLLPYFLPCLLPLHHPFPLPRDPSPRPPPLSGALAGIIYSHTRTRLQQFTHQSIDRKPHGFKPNQQNATQCPTTGQVKTSKRKLERAMGRVMKEGWERKREVGRMKGGNAKGHGSERVPNFSGADLDQVWLFSEYRQNIVDEAFIMQKLFTAWLVCIPLPHHL